jgi:two-component system chemotaxis response regulator CheB
MKVLVVEDIVTSRILLCKILKKEGYEVLSASNGVEALDLIANEKFDAILTDWMMPNLDGIELIEKIRKTVRPIPVIIVITALSSRSAKEKAFEAGADDYIAKPYDNKEVVARLENCLNRLKSDSAQFLNDDQYEFVKVPPFAGVCIAASTGGPPALLNLFSKLQPTMKAAFFVVLHGPAWMLESFTERIQRETSMKVKLGEEGMPIKPGEIYLAPGDRHMVINPQKLCIEITDGPPENYVKPSADPLFRSVAFLFKSKSLSVILTGMGRDGAIGSGYISAAGGITIAQDPKTATLPSMPQSIIDLRIAKVIAPLDEIGEIVNKSIDRIS